MSMVDALLLYAAQVYPELYVECEEVDPCGIRGFPTYDPVEGIEVQFHRENGEADLAETVAHELGHYEVGLRTGMTDEFNYGLDPDDRGEFFGDDYEDADSEIWADDIETLAKHFETVIFDAAVGKGAYKRVLGNDYRRDEADVESTLAEVKAIRNAGYDRLDRLYLAEAA